MKEYEKIYHIYAKNRCVYHNLSEEKFSETWEMLHRMIDLLDVDISKEEEVANTVSPDDIFKEISE